MRRRFSRDRHGSDRSRPAVVLLALTLLTVGGCGGTSGGVPDDDDDAPELFMPPDEASVPDDSAPIPPTTIETPSGDTPTPWVNGFRLASERREGASGLFPPSEQRYRIGADGRSIERFRVSDAGETIAIPEVIHRFDANGFIVSRENVRPDGTASQTFDSSYDAAGRKVREQSFNDDTPFLTSDYTYDADARLVGQRVTVTRGGSLFSDRVYTYASDGSLATIRLSSPGLPFDLLREFSMDPDSGRPSEIREIDVRDGTLRSSESFEYDADGNLVRIERRGASGGVSSVTTHTYEATSDTVPNLPLHEIAHDIDQF